MLLIAAVVLLAIPAAFTILAPELLRWPFGARALVVAGFGVGTFLTARQALRRDESLERLADLFGLDPPDVETTMQAGSSADYQSLVAAEVVEHLLEERWPGLRRDFDITLYLYDPDADLLIPEFPRDVEEPESKVFRPGDGATGTAWSEQQFTVVEGDDVSNATYGLTPRQQRLFRRYRSVAAHPVLVNGVPIGVVMAISRRNDGYWSNPRTRQALRLLATAVGVVLIGGESPADASLPPGA
jgi:GAF domain-containing protein